MAIAANCLWQISQLAGTISADDLSQGALQLERAPSEVKELAQAFNMTLSRLSAAGSNSNNLLVMSPMNKLRTPNVGPRLSAV